MAAYSWDTLKKHGSRYLRTLGVNYSDMEDLFQDAALAATRQGIDMFGNMTFSLWRSMLKQALVDQIRQERRMRVPLETEAETDAKEAARDRARDLVTNVYEESTEAERSLMESIVNADYNTKEAPVISGVNPNTFRWSLMKLRERREHLVAKPAHKASFVQPTTGRPEHWEQTVPAVEEYDMVPVQRLRYATAEVGGWIKFVVHKGEPNV